MFGQIPSDFSTNRIRFFIFVPILCISSNDIIDNHMRSIRLKLRPNIDCSGPVRIVEGRPRNQILHIPLKGISQIQRAPFGFHPRRLWCPLEIEKVKSQGIARAPTGCSHQRCPVIGVSFSTRPAPIP